VPSQKDVIATYGHGWPGDTLLEEDGAVDRALPAEWGRVMDYDDLDALISLTAQELDLDPDHPCLRSLEVDAHGSPTGCDAIQAASIAAAGQKLMTLKWCDNGSIYLAGCNTGNKIPGAGNAKSVAEQLANAMAYNASSFPHHITVYGSNGYLSGTHMQGNESTSPTTRIDGTDYPGYTDGQQASGSACWREFRNW
jgi:hypothetical protein